MVGARGQKLRSALPPPKKSCHVGLTPMSPTVRFLVKYTTMVVTEML